MGRRRQILIKRWQLGRSHKSENLGVQFKSECDDNGCAGDGKKYENLNGRSKQGNDYIFCT